MNFNNQNKKGELCIPTNLDFQHLDEKINAYVTLHGEKKRIKLTKTTKIQIEFLLHQIDHFTKEKGVFHIYKELYYNFLGLSPNHLNNMLDILEFAGFIRKGETGKNKGKYVAKSSLTEYWMVTPLDKENSKNITYYFQDGATPEFINQWIYDQYKVLAKTQKKQKVGLPYVPYKQLTTYVKMVKQTHVKNVKPDSKLVRQLQNKIEEQQGEIEALQAELNALKTLQGNVNVSIVETIAAPVVVSDEVIFQPVAKNIDVTLDHEALLHEEAPDIIEPVIDIAPLYIFKYGTDDYAVTGWNYLVQVMKNDNLSIEEIQAEIYDLDENKTEEIYENLKIYKKYDVSDLRYIVQISA